MKDILPRSRAYSKGSLVYFIVGVPMMMMLFFVFPSLFSGSVEQAKEQVREDVKVSVQLPVASYARGGRELKVSRVGEAHNYPLFAEYYPVKEDATPKVAVEAPGGLSKLFKPKKKYSYNLKNTGSDKARIAIVIDDVGMNRKQSQAAVDIKNAPITLAFLPYAPNLSALTKPAAAAGHELIIHMPMEPMDGSIDTGPIALKSDMTNAQLREMLDKAFNSFDGYVGINNHMGSRLTQDRDAMKLVMDTLDKEGLFYLDSKTIGSSIAAASAREKGLPFAERDVFLDHQEGLDYARNALKKAEKLALDKGYAIAIGHPKADTIQALNEWIPTLEARGFEVVPVSQLLKVPSDGAMKVATLERKFEKKPVRQDKKAFIKKEPALQDIQPAAGKAVEEEPVLEKAAAHDGKVAETVDWDEPVNAEDLLNAPIGVSEDATDGLYSLSE